jgi:hypothetical protein
MGDEDPLQTVGAIPNLKPEERTSILAGTASRLLDEDVT